MAAIATMDTGKSDIIDHFTADTSKWLNGFKMHESFTSSVPCAVPCYTFQRMATARISSISFSLNGWSSLLQNN